MSNIKLASWRNDDSAHIPQVNIGFYVGQKLYYRISADPASKALPPASSATSAPAAETTDVVFTFEGRTPPVKSSKSTEPKRVDYIHGDHRLLIENFLDGTTETITINIPNNSPDNPATSETETRLNDLEDLFANLVMPRGYFEPYMMGYGRRGPSNELMNRVEKIWGRTRDYQSDSMTLYYEVIGNPEIAAKMNAVEQQLLDRIKTDPVFQFSFIEDTRGHAPAIEALVELVPDLVYMPELIDAINDRHSDYFFKIVLKFGAPTDSMKEKLFERVRNLYPNQLTEVMSKVFPDGIPQKYQTEIIGKFSKADAVKIIPNLTEESQFLILGDKHSNIKHISNPTKAVLAKTKRLKNEYLLSQVEADA